MNVSFLAVSERSAFLWVEGHLLTCTHSFFVPRLVRTVVAVQSLVVVARVGLVAHLADLPGAGPAAVAAVHQQADARRADGRHHRTLARPLAVLRAVVRLLCGGRNDGGSGGGGGVVGGDHSGRGRRHGSGILGEDLERSTEVKGQTRIYNCAILCFFTLVRSNELTSDLYGLTPSSVEEPQARTFTLYHHQLLSVTL